jgi:hypothetical protein
MIYDLCSPTIPVGEGVVRGDILTGRAALIICKAENCSAPTRLRFDGHTHDTHRHAQGTESMTESEQSPRASLRSAAARASKTHSN